jgi:hypothetical protein
MTYPAYLNGTGAGASGVGVWLTLEALNFYYASSNTGGAVNVLGWRDAVNAN